MTPEVRAAVERVMRLGAQATPGPFVWTPASEKDNGWVLGQAWDKNDKPLGPGGISFEEWREDAQEYIEIVGRAAPIMENEETVCNYADPEFFAHARTDAPLLAREVERLSGEVERLRTERQDWQDRFKASENLRAAETEREVGRGIAFNLARDRAEKAESEIARLTARLAKAEKSLSKIAACCSHEHLPSGCSDLCPKCIAARGLTAAQPEGDAGSAGASMSPPVVGCSCPPRNEAPACPLHPEFAPRPEGDAGEGTRP